MLISRLRQSFWLVICFLCTLSTGLAATWLQTQRSLLHELRDSLNHAIVSIDNTLYHGEMAAKSAIQWLGDPCDDTVLTGIRTLVATIPDVRTVNLVKGNEIYCTSVFGGRNFIINAEEYTNGKLLLLKSNTMTPSRSLIVYRSAVQNGNSALAGIDGYYLYNILHLLENDTPLYLMVGNRAMNPQGVVTDIPKLKKPLSLRSENYDYTVIADTAFIYQLPIFIRHEKNMLALIFIFSFFITFLFSRYLIYLNTIESLLKVAIRKKQITPWIQPIVSASSGKFIGGEILLRWNHPQLGFIPPDRFIPAAEQNGLINRITRDCFSDVAKALEKWVYKNEVPLIICFNVSAGNFENDEIVTLCQSFNSRVSKDSFRIALEITERDYILHSPTTINIINKLKQENVQIALDDFGTGNANYSYLSLFKPDYIKIDKFFTSGIKNNVLSSVVIESIISLAIKIDCSVIAEGIEDNVQKDILLRMGVPLFQGYYFSRPVQISDFLSLMRSSESY
ncbi:cyclic diguanylate phosphodiesterase (plasmid) [Enterobacter kobei]|nr:cyclic diguanylate phosphodiesterase [Enterobacter kobei]MBO4154602.1 cyclic diguanylate phosphodiesterase [Enterobacter kobei]UOY68667.1 cyclic diguanylate phosphodiesterase [Enterobacter kobei]